ncbi:UDP-glucose dehydrogenase family protein [Alkalicoccobacillus porphyridii]|uniref:UDP-glucose 6-dehydrogenase n=1 Tax=Alkalicoccobacillus porphyridii TaxID=2597270 RepID=A0A554A3W9_9BACI|nr:UDP-glucose/GDP-mannose dehydrogenase family protein [Alkalicoccobacillus porphyridii]TSB48368.1 UDP-glucose/GDP-mannose dehydrogenase family protein [Alkalicoccobacillus porphyridii]
MKVCVVGTGYVGLVSGVCFSDIGHQVVCVDNDQLKIDKLRRAEATIYEPGLEELLQKNIKQNQLSFSKELSASIKDAEIVVIAVGTPANEDGSANLKYIEAVAKEIGQHLTSYKVIVTKSTVPVGTGQKVKGWIKEQCGEIPFDVASNPEFLREGSAIHDTMHMERAVLGVETEKAAQYLKNLHAPFNTHLIVTDIETAEMSKYAANAFLATKISFINEVANLCEKLDADVTKVAETMGFDPRIGAAFLGAGIGYGGSCFPKDTQAFIQMGIEAGYNLKIVPEVEKVNFEQRKRLVDKIELAFSDSLKGKHIAVLGLAFKPNTDDMRAAPAIDIIPMLLEKGAKVKAYDPVAMDRAMKIMPYVDTAESWQEAVKEANAVVILTDWKEFKEIDLDVLKSKVTDPILIDGRNVFDPVEMREKGFYYDSVGRKKMSIEGDNYESIDHRGSGIYRQKLS